MNSDNSQHDCGGCTLVGRRTFVREAALAAAALALPVHMIEALALHRESATYPMPTADGVFIDKKNEVIVARAGGQVYAFMLACPHQNTALRWNASVHRFQCPKHHSQYQADGTFIDGRATRSMDRFGVKRDGSNLVVDLDKVYEDDKDHAGWKAAAIAG
jgi:Rieske Fe-S protein